MGCSSTKTTPVSTPFDSNSSYNFTDDEDDNRPDGAEDTAETVEVIELVEEQAILPSDTQIEDQVINEDLNKERIPENKEENLPDTPSFISRTIEDSNRGSSNLQKEEITSQTDAVDVENSNTCDTFPSTKTDNSEGKSSKEVDNTTDDLHERLKSILLKTEQKKREIFVAELNESDKATIHLCHSFRDTAPLSPAESKDNVTSSVSTEVPNLEAEEPIETAETNSIGHESPW